MARVKRAVHGKKHHRAVLEQAQGYYGNKSRTFRAANEQLLHSLQYAYRDRRARKGDFRQLWIQRINAAARLNGPELQPVHRRPAPGGRRGGPQGPGRPGRDRPRGLRALWCAVVRQRRLWPTADRGRLLTQALAFSHQRVRRLRRLLRKRAVRWSERAFVVEGVELVPTALEAGVAVESVFVATIGARSRRARRSARGRRGRGPGLRARARGGRAGGRHRDPQPVLAVLRADRPSPRGDRGGRRSSSSASTCATPATPARSCGAPTPPASTRWSAATAPSTRTTRRRCGRRPARSSTCPSWSAEPRRGPRRCSRDAGCGVSAPSPAAGTTTPTVDWSRADAPSCSATRRRGSPTEVLAVARRPVTIPMAGRAESLNVGVACAVLCFEALRQRRDGCGQTGADGCRPRGRDGCRPESGDRRLAGSGPMAIGPRSDGQLASHPRGRGCARSWTAPAPPRACRAAEQSILGKRSPLGAAPRIALGGLDRRAARRSVGGSARAPARASKSWSGAAARAVGRGERAAALAADRLDLTEVVLDQVRAPIRPRPPAPGHADPGRARGRLRGHGVRGGRGPRGRDRLVQLRGPQHAAGPSGPGHVGHLLPEPRRARDRRCCAPTPRRCRSG